MTKKTMHAFRAGALALLAATALSARADLVTNGGFETGDFTGWTTSNAPGLDSLYGVDSAGPRQGDYSAYFGASAPSDTISQTIATLANAAYNVTFWLDVGAATGADGFFVASLNGAPIYTAPASGLAFGPISLAVWSTSADSVLSFSAYNVADFYTLDSISVTALPEPGTALLLAAGLLAAGAARRRRTTH